MRLLVTIMLVLCLLGMAVQIADAGISKKGVVRAIAGYYGGHGSGCFVNAMSYIGDTEPIWPMRLYYGSRSWWQFILKYIWKW